MAGLLNRAGARGQLTVRGGSTGTRPHIATVLAVAVPDRRIDQPAMKDTVEPAAWVAGTTSACP